MIAAAGGPGGTAEFRSGRAWWATLPLWLTTAFAWLSAVWALNRPELGGEGVAVSVFLAVMGFVPLWILGDTAYALSRTDLRVRSGPFSMRVDLKRIRRASTEGPHLAWSFALARRGTVWLDVEGMRLPLAVSPERQGAFLDALQSRIPDLEVLGPGGAGGSE